MCAFAQGKILTEGKLIEYLTTAAMEAY